MATSSFSVGFNHIRLLYNQLPLSRKITVEGERDKELLQSIQHHIYYTNSSCVHLVFVPLVLSVAINIDVQLCLLDS